MNTLIARIHERIDITNCDNNNSDDYRFYQSYLCNLYLPFFVVTIENVCSMILKETTLKKKYPVLYTLCDIIMNDRSGYAIFGLKYLSDMILWMRLIHMRYNEKLSYEQITQESDQYTADYVFKQRDRQQWENVDKQGLEKILNGFVNGWNHIAECVTTDKSKVGATVDAVGDDINPLKRYFEIYDVCTTVSIPSIASTSITNNRDVPMSYAIYTGSHDDLATSVQIGKIIEMCISKNNQILENYFAAINGDDNYDQDLDASVPPLQRLKSSTIANKCDVVDMDEDELREMFQEYFLQRLRFGVTPNSTSNSDDFSKKFNLQLLEHHLKRRYIFGRKLIDFDIETNMKFNFFNSSNISQLIDKIDFKYGASNDNASYFEQAPNVYLSGIKRDLMLMSQNVNKNKEMECLNCSLRSIELVIQSLERQSTSLLPDGSVQISKYIKDHVEFGDSESDFDLLIKNDQLLLKHSHSLWKYVQKLMLLKQDKWQQIPNNCLQIYLAQVDDVTVQQLQQFIDTQTMENNWEFLVCFKSFIENRLCREITQRYQHETQNLKMYLIYEDGISEDMVDCLPDTIVLAQAGYCYYHLAKCFQARMKRE